ncbi:uncharacterized protein LOC142002098 [Carettochelys insculpta]|uniref:uncharacterized protein LOC142002098 n=1 Tax=Carettochelys insculpta TaxID=44489 RepID=UPI003EBFDB35
MTNQMVHQTTMKWKMRRKMGMLMEVKDDDKPRAFNILRMINYRGCLRTPPSPPCLVESQDGGKSLLWFCARSNRRWAPVQQSTCYSFPPPNYCVKLHCSAGTWGGIYCDTILCSHSASCQASCNCCLWGIPVTVSTGLLLWNSSAGTYPPSLSRHQATRFHDVGLGSGSLRRSTGLAAGTPSAARAVHCRASSWDCLAWTWQPGPCQLLGWSSMKWGWQPGAPHCRAKLVSWALGHLSVPPPQNSDNYGQSTSASSYESKQYYPPVATQPQNTAADPYSSRPRHQRPATPQAHAAWGPGCRHHGVCHPGLPQLFRGSGWDPHPHPCPGAQWRTLLKQEGLPLSGPPGLGGQPGPLPGHICGLA